MPEPEDPARRINRRPDAPLFPERTVYVRDAAGARVLTLSPRAQRAGAFAVGALLLWTVSATAMLALSGIDDGGREAAAAAEARAAALGAERDAAEAAARRAEARAEAALEALAERHAAAGEALSEAHGLRAAIARLRGDLEATETAREAVEAEAAEGATRLAEAEAALALAESERREFADTLERIALALGDTAAARDDAVAAAREAEGVLGALEAGVEQDRDRRQQLFAELEQAAAAGLDGLEAMLSDAGVDVDAVLERLRREQAGEGQGGPFVAASDAAEGMGGPERTQALEVMEDLERVNLLRVAAARMPFATPVSGARLTSGFGGRRDPINGRRAVHEGLDFAGRHGTPIHAAADGVVTFAGAMRGYGRVVKIRHDFGFETVYAHMSRIRVKVGEPVSRMTRVGDMGNTGRSTGTHLHYEIRIDGTPVNPMKFIEAARNVL